MDLDGNNGKVEVHAFPGVKSETWGTHFRGWIDSSRPGPPAQCLVSGNYYWPPGRRITYSRCSPEERSYIRGQTYFRCTN